MDNKYVRMDNKIYKISENSINGNNYIELINIITNEVLAHFNSILQDISQKYKTNIEFSLFNFKIDYSDNYITLSTIIENVIYYISYCHKTEKFKLSNSSKYKFLLYNTLDSIQQNFYGKFIPIYGYMYEICVSNVLMDNTYSLKNLLTNKYLRHYKYSAEDYRLEDINDQSPSTSFYIKTQNNFASICCIEEEFKGKYLNFSDKENKLIISNKQKFEFNIIDNYKKFFKLSQYKLTNDTERLLKKLCDIEEKVARLEQYKSFEFNINNLPQGSGVVRIMQLGVLKLLNTLKSLCDKEGVKFWLDGGNLLGSYRHKAFIPWDDDVDISFLSEDNEKMIDIMDRLCEIDPRIGHIKDDNDQQPYIYLKTGGCHIDYFRWDILRIPKTNNSLLDSIDLFRKCDSYDSFKNFLRNLDLSEDNSIKVLAPEKRVYAKYGYRPLQYEWIFPLKEDLFENIKFYVPNFPEMLLIYWYLNFDELPKSYHLHFNHLRHSYPLLGLINNYIYDIES